MPSNITLIKNKLVEWLTALSPVIKEVIIDDFTTNVFNQDIGAFPVAIVPTPSTASEAFTNGENLRTHTFEIVVMQKLENLTHGANEIEDLIEALLNKFDEDPMLDGLATGGVEPTFTAPEIIAPNSGGSYVIFSIVLRIKITNYINP